MFRGHEKITILSYVHPTSQDDMWFPFALLTCSQQIKEGQFGMYPLARFLAAFRSSSLFHLLDASDYPETANRPSHFPHFKDILSVTGTGSYKSVLWCLRPAIFASLGDNDDPFMIYVSVGLWSGFVNCKEPQERKEL